MTGVHAHAHILIHTHSFMHASMPAQKQMDCGIGCNGNFGMPDDMLGMLGQPKEDV